MIQVAKPLIWQGLLYLEFDQKCKVGDKNGDNQSQVNIIGKFLGCFLLLGLRDMSVDIQSSF